jgi:hypothetical protein
MIITIKHARIFLAGMAIGLGAELVINHVAVFRMAHDFVAYTLKSKAAPGVEAGFVCIEKTGKWICSDLPNVKTEVTK